ncbi:transporter substrate-binding domain-containing protein [Shewanella mesophila]|uniref:ATP-binding protein n=1 Tax=Shewanella mesophila TaxID=2864208 RepID=UPI001C6591F8|nr:transporter substrate-binding domain-containing protein [Shewanella mesophila]QYJ86019.1 transporter substrate-binding domain-containing protein [Shewanella mesophila]
MHFFSLNRAILFGVLWCLSFCSLADKCIVTLGVSETDYRPYSWVDEERRAQGLNIELMNSLAAKSSCELKVKVFKWNELLLAFKHNEIDTLVTSLSPFADTVKGHDLLQIPITTMFYGNFYVRKNSLEIESEEDLYDKEVIVLEGSTSSDYVRNRLREKYNVKIISYRSTEEAIKALSEGKGDVGIFSLTAVRNAVESEHVNNLKLSGAAFLPASYGFIFHRENMNLFLKLKEHLGFAFGIDNYSEKVNTWSSTYNAIGENQRNFLIFTILFILIFLFIITYNHMLEVKVKDRTKKLKLEIEHRKALEKEHFLIKEQSMSIAKLAALGEMASCVAHEINNPTALIIHNMSSIKRRFSNLVSLTPESLDKNVIISQVKDNCLIIEDSLNRTVKSIEQLKKIGGDYCESKKIVDICSSLRTALELTKYYVGKYTLNLNVNIPDEECYVLCAENTVEQIAINLIQNACHALKNQDGVIECGVITEVVDDKECCSLYVNDTGIGISESGLKLIFKPFYTSRRGQGGTGLGLSIVSRLVKENDAKIEVISSAGNGTRVSVLFNKVKSDS